MCSYIKFALRFLEMFQVLMIHDTLWNQKGQGCMFAWRPEEQKLYEFWLRGDDRSQRSRFLQGLTQKSQDFTDFWSIWKYLHLQRCSIELKWVANRLPVGIFERQCPAWGPEGCQSNCKCICEDMHRQTRDKQPNIYRKKTQVEVIRNEWGREHRVSRLRKRYWWVGVGLGVLVGESCGGLWCHFRLLQIALNRNTWPPLYSRGMCRSDMEKWKNCAWEQIGKKTLHELPIGINSELFVLLAMAGEARADCHISCSTYGLGSSNSSNLIRFLSNL